MVDSTPQASAEVAQGSSSTAEDGTRGRPYYEQLRKDLRQTIEKKRELDKTMMQLETAIAQRENTYLEDTVAAGNIIKGFDNYIKASASSGGGGGTGTGTATRRKGGISEQDRIFSRSSVSWTTRDSPTPVLMGNGEADLLLTNGNTPTAATPQSGATGSASANKGSTKTNKKKTTDKDDADGEGDRPNKRSKISWGRD